MSDQASLDLSTVWCPDCKGEHRWNACPLAGLCLTCKTRLATLHFGDMLSFTHGGQWNCCDLCAAEKQLAFAIERADAIPELRTKVDQLRAAARIGTVCAQPQQQSQKQADSTLEEQR